MRRDGPLVVIDCASIPRTLLEAELFGHERGAYTGATQMRLGAFVRANGGTIFLDEIGELDLDLQPRLLRVLEQREVRPLGGAEPIPVDVRVIAATNRDLRREVDRGAFREDLFYRLAVARVRLPPLRERTSDIPVLVRHFLQEHSRQDRVAYALDDLLPRLMAQPWPGNVRELRNAVERFVTFENEGVPGATASVESAAVDVPFKVAKADLISQFEHGYLVSVLGRHGGNITAAASHAELDRVHFLRLLDRHGLRKPRPRTS
jgi:DNA-binding NtrC family response regulator